jgi:hypothetical protein
MDVIVSGNITEHRFLLLANAEDSILTTGFPFKIEGTVRSVSDPT